MPAPTPLGAKQYCTRRGRERGAGERACDPRDDRAVRAAFAHARREDPRLDEAATVLGEAEALDRFGRGLRRALRLDLRRRDDLWTHELVAVTVRVPPELRERLDRIPGRRREDRLRALLDRWERQATTKDSP